MIFYRNPDGKSAPFLAERLMRGDRLMSVSVRGHKYTWAFCFYGKPKDIQEWREDGLDVVEIENIIPEWVVTCNLTKFWCFFQDIWNLKNPWK